MRSGIREFLFKSFAFLVCRSFVRYLLLFKYWRHMVLEVMQLRMMCVHTVFVYTLYRGVERHCSEGTSGFLWVYRDLHFDI
jgi:hypothetical protein